MYERCSVFLDIDLIDHITKAVRDGKPFDKKRSVELLKTYRELHDAVASAETPVEIGALTEETDDKLLYDTLIAVREALIATVL